jgi:uncharacterized membrane protein (UPF0127 family)
MRRLIARNASLGKVIADHVGVAATRASRAVGLLSRSGLEPGEALWIVPSRVSDLRPWRVRLPRRGTAGVLELPAGTLAASGTGVGDQVILELAQEGRP